MKIGKVDVVATVKATVKDFIESDLQGMAAEMAYHLLFSLLPLLIFFTALSGEIGRRIGTGDIVDQLTNWLRTSANLPASTIDVVLVPIEEVLDSQTGGLLSIGALVALWSGKNAIMALMKGLNVAYSVEESRPWYISWPIAVGLTILLALAGIVGSVFTVLSSGLGRWIAVRLQIELFWETVWQWLRLPLVAVILCIIVSFFYWAGPNRRARYEFITIGSIFTVLMWGVVTMLLGLYFQYLASYVIAYGVLGGLLGFLFWLNLMTLVLLLGGQLNAVIKAQTEPGSVPATRVDRASARKTEQAPGPGAAAQPAAPVAATRSILDEVRAQPRVLPSAEAAARHQALVADPPTRQRTSTLRLLGAAAAAAISAVLVGMRNRE